MKNYIKISFFILVFININLLAISQDSLSKVYDSETIYRYGNKFMKGNERITDRNMELEFNTQSTKELYKKSKSRLFLSKLFTLASLGVTTTSIFTPTNTSGSIKFALGTGFLALFGIYFHTQSSKYLDKAIWQRNREILFNTPH